MERIAHPHTFSKLKASKDLLHQKYVLKKPPAFLEDQDWYFENFDPCIDMDTLQVLSDSERV